MSRSKPQEFSNEMMFMEDSSNYKANTSRRHKIKRMEELSHSLDDGLNYIQDDYARGAPQGAAGRYDDYEDEDFVDDEYIDDYYYNNKAFDGRPKSYNDKYSYMYDEYDQNPGNSRQAQGQGQGQENYRYNSNEPAKGHPRYNQSVSVQQQKQQQFQQPSTFRRTHDGSAPSLKQSQAGPSGNGSKHILFNDEDDVCYVAESHKKQKAPAKVEKVKTKKSDTKKEPSSPTSLFSLKKSKPKKEEESQKNEKSGQVMKARLKLQNVSNDDSVLQMRNSKTNMLYRHHSIESKVSTHGPERNMSPTILEEIEFENQEEDTDELEKEKSSSSKEKSKDKKGALDSPTTKKSFKSHLTSHKKLFKVPDIDLNNLKFSCFFNSNKNIALGSKSASTPAVVSTANTTSSKISINSDRNDLNDNCQKSTENIMKNSKEQKIESKVEKKQDVERKEIQGIQKGSRNSSSVQNSNENMVDNSSVVSDVEFESQAMRVVRTVGQAFEVCHKISMQKKALEQDDNSELISDLDHCSDIQNLSDFDEPKKVLDTTPILMETTPKIRPNHLENLTSVSPGNMSLSSPTSPTKLSNIGDDNKETNRELIYKEQLHQQTQQTKQALAQLILVREQLVTETNARIEAQARTQQLLQQNRELLEHIASLSGLSDAERPGLTAATIGMAPQQQQLPHYYQSMGLMGNGPIMSPQHQQLHMMPKNIESSHDDINNNNSKHNSIQFNHQFNNAGMSLNQQLANMNLDNLHIFQNTMQAYNQINKMAVPQNLQQDPNILAQQELYHLNQELLNRLKNLNVGYSATQTPTSNFGGFPNDPSNTFIFSNSATQSFQNNNNNGSSGLMMSQKNPPPSDIHTTNSPIGTLNRSSSTYSTISPLDDNLCLSFDQSLDNINNNQETQFIKPISQAGAVPTLDADGKVKVIVPVAERLRRDNENHFFGDSGASGGQRFQQRIITPILSRTEKKVTLPGVVTLKVTDESGNVTNQRKLPAQPSFITRSTSEKVPNRSQMMSQVQRQQWARHTTK